MKKTKRIYLDYAASTPIGPSVLLAMKNAEKLAWANPSSLHNEGERAKNILDEARKEVAKILHCKASEVFFTSGGTEGANIAVLGVIEKAIEVFKNLNLPKGQARISKLPHIITSTIEHPAILEPIKHLLKRGEIEVSFISPDGEGLITPKSIEKEIKANTILVCIMHSNNEIGTIQPIRRISSLLKSHTPSFISHTPYLLVDASQSVCYEDVSIERLGADILILDGIKMYGPRGAGILVVKHAIAMIPIVFGGGQEHGLRSGTENVVAAVGLAEALKICEKTREKESVRLKKLRDYAINKILTQIPGSSLNGSQEYRLPNNINVCFLKEIREHLSREARAERDAKWDSEFLVIKLDTLGFAVSAASACHNLSLENSSYVIESLGKPECASSSLRFTLGHQTTKSDLDKLIAVLKKIVL
ncbi:MAG: cysteine desulfurase family protein [Patescibacteria group bacterium]